MIFYIASNIYQETVSRTIKETGGILTGGECSNEFYLLKYVKENVRKFSELDVFIIDLSALNDTDIEILDALDMIRLMYDQIRIVILATNRGAGDNLLSKCFQMSIYDIINTDDFLEIRNELEYCLSIGKKYKDSVAFKDNKPQEKVIIKNEIKQVVNKVLVGVAGAVSRIGVTHNSIVLANHLRKRGFMVAVVEMNISQDFEMIRESFNGKILDESYFSIEGVDYYPGTDSDKLGSVLGKSYNFIIADFGDLTNNQCDRVNFNKSDVRIVITGSKPWEIENVNKIFEISSKETLKQYHYCFNFTIEKHQNEIRQGMGELEQVYFLRFNEDPFIAFDFPTADVILKEYMPIKIAEEKKKWIFRKK